MNTKKKNNLVFPIFTLVLLTASILGATWLTPKLAETWENWFSNDNTPDKQEYLLNAPSQVLPLVTLDEQKQQEQLLVIAKSSEKSLDKSRARYLIASQLLREYKGGEALEYLKGLDKQYPILAPYILLKKGRAYELTNEENKAKKIWLNLLEKYPESLVTAEALYKLGKYDKTYWQTAITSFPSHPRTHDIARELLKENPEKFDLMLLLGTYDKSSQSDQVRDKLIKEYSNQLTAENWQMIADNYWDRELFLKATQSYPKAPPNPQNLYRIARSYELINQKDKAKTAYQNLKNKFPTASETGLGLRRLAALSPDNDALAYLQIVINKFPQDAPQALVQKAAILSKLGKNVEATQTKNSLLTNFSNSDQAATYRWQLAKKAADSGDLLSAWQKAQEITVNNPNSDVTPKAAFWVGKWAQKLGQTAQAQTAFKYVIKNSPQSYYAWRSAVQLGWDVGDFNNVRSMNPSVKKLETRPLPPGGSTMFKELFLLGEDQEAIDLFNAEMGTKNQLTVSEKFTEGLLKQLQGKNLESINLIWNLKEKKDPQSQQEWQILRKSQEYWQTLFPFPYEDLILKWSKERNLNPLLVTGLIRQESRFEPKIKSPVGATGLMQVMPDTAKFIAPQINLKDYSLTDPNDSINLGTWYLDHTHETYKNNSMLAVASYNAGPGNVDKWVKKYNLSDVDQFVEDIPFAETKGYIESVFGNYWNYLRIYTDLDLNNGK